MATGTGKHKLLSTGPTEPWSIREKLCLASSVMRSGDQNWVSVSRAIKPFAEPGRPPDWFSQKHCASQYSELLETTETPKRKRGEKGEVVETVEDVIVRKLTAERVEELKKVIKETQERYRRLKRDAELIQAGHMDSRLDELCNDIAMKKKLEEEEAEVKRKATDAAYQARQAVKTPPRRLPTVMVRSPIDSASPGGDYPLGDLTPTTMEEATSGVNESEMSVASGHLNSTGVLLEVGGVLPMIHGGEMQPTTSTVAASPAASGAPTLSRLLEAGPTQFSTPLPSFTAVASEPPVKLGPPPGESVSQATIVMMPALPAPSSAPAVSTPDSVAPVSQPESCVPLEAVGDPHTVTVSMDSSEISMIINSIKEECFRSGVAEAPGGSKAPSIDGKEDLDLAEKMDIAVSYTGEELDFETVGDIIAIIEDKVDDHPEVLDVAAVEAALSFCEENDDPQSLPGPWEHPIQQERDKPVSLPAPEMTVKQERLDFEEPENKGIHELVDIRESGVEIKVEPAEPEPGMSGAEIVAGVGPVSSMEPPELRSQDLDEEPRSSAAGEIGETDGPGGKGDEMPLSTVKTEASPESMLSPSHGSNPIEDPLEAETQHKFEMSDPLKEESGTIFGSQIKDAPGEEEEEDGVSEVASLEEPKEEDQGEGYLSEMDNEPPVSESDDGFSIHNATLQSHTLADSIPSSPASSQFSVCSEDQEAIQAQKIWKKAIMLVWRAAANHRYANVFLQPVTDDIAPGYHSIVQRPMDLSTIKKNIENGLIRSTAEFQRDIMLMFQNAVMYNSSDHDVYHMAVEMQRDVLEQIQQFLATQLIMQTSESGISAKSLRGRDSTRKQDASEKDSVPMGSPAFLLSLFMGCEWVWLDSGHDYRDDSELSNDCRSLFSSWDSSLDLDVGSWRETEAPDTEAEDLEESSPERESSEFLVEDVESEEPQEEAEQGSSQNPLHSLSEGEAQQDSKEEDQGEGDASDVEDQPPLGDYDDGVGIQETPLVDILYNCSNSSQLNDLSQGDPIQDHFLFKKTLLQVWKMIASHRFSSPFLKPVSEKQAPGYKDVVKRPMDLTTLKRNLSKGRIHTMAEFQRDLMLMFQNAVMYNDSDHHIYHMAVEMQREVLEQIQVLSTWLDKRKDLSSLG
ncbi:bromodomain-containing protein 8 isoform X10 [Peromyscus maniculatus bairdii]|uniref:bromodomain-containing protein 8 isoform X10 n=2 Tax=Peromyscus maniculatus bairdii TaxID=230844 RepID=UPI00077DE6E5